MKSRLSFGPVPRAGQGFFFGLLCAMLIALATPLGLLSHLERGVRDQQFQRRPRVFPSPDIVIVEVDDSVVYANPLPLPRRFYADLVERLTRAGAKTIAFDIQFPNPSSSPADDAALIRAVLKSGRVIQAAQFRFGLRTDYSVAAGNQGEGSALYWEKRFRVPSVSGGPNSRLDNGLVPNDGFIPTVWGIAAMPALQRGAAGLGFVSAPPDEDGVLRWVPHLISFRSGQAPVLYPSLSLTASAHFLGLSPAQIRARKGEITLPAPGGTRRIPVDGFGNTWVNWLGGNKSFTTHSLGMVLRGQVPDSAFKDKIVVVGVTSTGSSEIHPTPFSKVQPAVELQANAIDDILMNRPLRNATQGVWLALMIAFSGLVGGITMTRPVKWSGLATVSGCVALWFAAFYALSRLHYVLPITAALVAGCLTWSVCVAWLQLTDARRLRLAEERYALAVRGANDGIWDWDLQSGKIYFSPRWKTMLGYGETEIQPRTDEWFGRVHSEDLEHMKAQLDAHLAGGSAHFESQHRIRHKDGRYLHVLSRGLRVCDEQGAPSRMAGSQSDISAQISFSQQLERSAFYDSLTNLANRALFMQLMTRALSSPRRRGDYRFAVLFLDLDRFKVINESLGHGRGDELLIGIARRLERALRPGDTAARLGADEFTVLLDDVGDIGVATRVAERIQEDLSKVFVLDGQEIYPTISIGIAISSPEYKQADELLRDADTAMYRAKSAGRARHAIFDEEMHAAVLDTLRLETDLRHALQRREFFVVYQPIVHLESGEIAGFEALVRWNHPTRGLISPGEFIPLAEETGLIVALDHYVLREACDQVQAWHAMFPGRELLLSANLSSKQFLQLDLVAKVEETLRQSQLPPAALKLEITEGVLMNDPEAAAALLQSLRDLGIRLSIDDFGTGYSSLSYLHSFPLNTLKIDQSFVKRMEADGTSRGQGGEIVTTIVQLARNLRMDVIAEGIETAHQLERLRAIDCDFGQGYFFSRPIPAADAEKLLASGVNWTVGE